MALNVNSTAALLGAYGVIDEPRGFLLDLFYRDTWTFDTQEIYFDRVQRARAIAPFVSPHIAGHPRRSRGYQTFSFTPPYVKPKHVVEPSKGLFRRAGERLLGEMSAGQRFEMAILDNMRLEDNEITRREEWMAAQELITGTVVVAGPDYPSQTIDFARNATHTVALTGAFRWGQAGVDPFLLLQNWQTIVSQDSGFLPRTVVMGSGAGQLFLQSPTIKTMMQSFRQTQGLVDLTGRVTGAIGDEVAYLGSTAQFDFWQYTAFYTDDAGAVQLMMPTNGVILGDVKGAGCTRTYGAIQDRQAGLKPLARFPKVWDMEDPSNTFTMTQSAPLPVMGWPDATFYALVA